MPGEKGIFTDAAKSFLLMCTVSTEVKDDSVYWVQERFAKLGVKGSFLPLSVQPKNIGLADWLAHKCKFERSSMNDVVLWN